MCGIAGFSLKPTAGIPAEMAQKLVAAMAHRGPDGHGIYTAPSGRNSLVHARLSIIDPAGGAQPLYHSAGKPIAIVANGEIYNYKQLQQRCQAMGASLNTGSDCEPPLYLYTPENTQWIGELKGMFAFALYDDTTGITTLARDPFGIKPLYYAETAAGVFYASEPAVLLRAGCVPAVLNTEQVLPLFARQYTTGVETLFAGIKRLLPGEVLQLKDGVITSRQRFLPPLKAATHQTEAEALEAFAQRFSATIQSHLQSDVPYGAFLSGGVDSSSVVWQMFAEVGQVRTFTIGFESDTVADERPKAEQLAKTLNTQHTGVLFSEDDFWHYLPQMALALDDLVADYAALPLLKLAERAKQDVKVILSGEGGDEIFAGYSRYRRRYSLWHRLTGSLGLRGKGDAAYFKKLWQPHLPNLSPAEPKLPYKTKGWSLLQKRQATDMQDWLPDDLLTKVDRCLMFHGVEGRVPFLDTDFAAFGFALPDGLKLRGHSGKWLLKHWINDKAPFLDVFGKKKGFTVPVADFLERKHAFVASFILANQGVQNVCNVAQLEKFLEKPFAKRRAKLVFSLLVFALWYNAHILQQPKTQEWCV